MRTETIPDASFMAETILYLERIVAIFGGRRLRLSAREERILEVLSRGPVTALDDIRAEIGASRPTVSRTLSKLERRGFVARSVRPDDRRSARIEITSEGEQALGRPVRFDRDRVRKAVDELHAGRRPALRNAFKLVTRWRADGPAIRRELQHRSGYRGSEDRG